MDIHDIQLDYVSFGSFCSLESDQLRHVKVLPYLSIAQAVEGSYDIALGGDASQNTGDGGAFIAPAHVQQTIVHNADGVSGRTTCRWVFLRVKINGLYDLDELYQFPTVMPPQARRELHALLDTLFDTDDITERYIVYYRLVRLLLSVGREKEHPLPSYIGIATAYIRRHYAEKITADDLAAQVNLSPSRFFAVFKKQMGISPIAYLNNYRLSLAVELLSGTDLTVTETAARVGIHDAVYFNKIFKKSYQMSPTAYRRMYKSSDV